MCLEDVVDLLAVGVGHLHSKSSPTLTALEAAALKRAVRLARQRGRNVTAGGAGRATTAGGRRTGTRAARPAAAVPAASIAAIPPPARPITSAKAAAVSAAGVALRTQRVLHAVCTQAQQRTRRDGLARILDRVVGDGEHVVFLIDQYRDL